MFNPICKMMLSLYFCCMPYCITIYTKSHNIILCSMQYCKQFAQCFYPKSDISFIKNSIICYQCNYTDGTDYLLNDYDYMVYTEIVLDKTLIKIINNMNQLIDSHNTNLIMQPCEFEFIMVLISDRNGSIDISHILKDKHNYYYVQDGLLFTKNFMNWLCINHLKRNLDDYHIVFLDNNTNEITLENHEFIKLSRDSYTIMSSNVNFA